MYKNRFEQLFLLQQQKEILNSFENQIDVLIRTITLTNQEIPNLEIITSRELQEIQNELTNDYDKDTLISHDENHPFEILQNSKLGIIAISDLLIMALKIPILNPVYYNISKLYPIPNREHISLIPPAKFYLKNYLEDRWTDSCQSIIGSYICKDLLTNQCNLQTQSYCNFAEVQEAEAYKLTSHGILTTFTNSKEVIEKCQNIITRHSLQMNNLISSKCPIIIDNNFIQTNNETIRLQIQDDTPLTLPEPTYKLKLQSSHLSEISRLKEDLVPLEKDLLLNDPVFNTTHATATTFITIFCIVTIIFLCIFRKRIQQLLCAKRHIIQLDPLELTTLQASQLPLDEDVNTKKGGVMSTPLSPSHDI